MYTTRPVVKIPAAESGDTCIVQNMHTPPSQILTFIQGIMPVIIKLCTITIHLFVMLAMTFHKILLYIHTLSNYYSTPVSSVMRDTPAVGPSESSPGTQGL